LTDLGIPRRARRSWWLEEALALPEFAGPETPPLERDVGADVVILGGGYTGMWTAWFLKEREPALDVVLLERDICGGGPSGRNGGFVNGLYEEAGLLLERYGEGGRRTIEAAGRSIDEVGAWCEDAGVEAWYEPSGDLGVSTNPAHDASVRETVSEAERLGFADVYQALSQDEVRERFDSPVVRTGFRVGHAATVHPARLARGLRRVLVERGVRIFEGTPVARFDARRPAAETPSGVVRAGRAIVALNAWARALRDFRRSLVLRGTYIVMSAPAPERLEAMRWTGGEGVYDLRTSLHYLRPTRDGRIAFGGSSFRVTGQGADSASYGYDERSASALVRDFRRWFPAFDGVSLETSWGGPVDVAGLHLPFFGTLSGGVTHYGLGFTGNGVGPCHLGGKILSGLALGMEDEATTLPISDGDRRRFPPEPLSSIGQRVVSRAIVRRDDCLDMGRSQGRLTDLLARLPRRLGYRLGP
jgi:glycine/D-amino acid oxidase-like deaminating enzyme